MEQQQNQPPQRQQLVLTSEEKKVYAECNSEAYWTRSFPLSVVFGGLAMVGMRRGVIAKSERFGMAPKAFGAIAVGYFLGKMTYIEKCKEKFLTQLPESNVSKMIRKNSGMVEPEYYNDRGAQQEADQANSEYFSPPDMQDSERMDKEPSRPKGMTYDELREQNRKSFHQPSPQPEQQPYFRPQSPPPLKTTEEEEFTPSRVTRPRNKYGDEGFE